ncbi:hypothetical protein Sjap_022940 [Stephania japonica]|uniref:SCP domain-containing protein n=1 Tax=Stephania japonica TaxID=461633 RepID=A0AAP0EVH8_9MAGN
MASLNTFLIIFTILILTFNNTPSHAKVKGREFINQIIQGHNDARREVGLAPLEWEPALAKFARVYSNERRRDCELVHTPNNGFGENLFWGQGRGWSGSDAVAGWVEEKQYYDLGSNSCSAGQQCGHYTQMVWRGTKKVGCAKVACHNGDTYITCEYYPPGNYVGERPY